ncbi:MAG TPA: hypoxanthine phosphoribosyltransferase [Ferruginibacter sp.]|jgi:hypoxanthine phosphoribosyltransferase|nr:hypoxanthine phosphoribosyltransferase [Bacteroidota bacterium]MCC6692323.1 hypoxanthine phosphoribosyltransferase [Chitinophagaceae bacterium]HMT95139.1 hypoxanthine phosphoribosyltransferase [Ferruginibacter sp.]MBS1926681.1 hypoxanthine phosphoribosyltransferase [Bacteroidota bacterium]HMU24634.1 hypoxanthine phosphoribosyltransferase [Ferruginibacter sp.]
MPVIKVHDKQFTPYLTEADITRQIKSIAEKINKDYEGKRPLFIAILNGSFMFASDLFKYLTIEAEISFIKLASYKGTKSTGNVITSIGLDEPLKGRHIIILEDIVDTGKTLFEFLPQLRDQQPASLKIAALLHKPDALKYQLEIDYLGFNVPNKFLIGFGLDYDGLARNLGEIYQLTGD